MIQRLSSTKRRDRHERNITTVLFDSTKMKFNTHPWQIFWNGDLYHRC